MDTAAYLERAAACCGAKISSSDMMERASAEVPCLDTVSARTQVRSPFR